jgi:hypothetical protein
MGSFLRLVAGVSAMAFSSVAQGEPLLLVCKGETRVVHGISGEVAEREILSLKVDLEDRAVTAGHYEPVPIVGETTTDTIAFLAPPGSIAGVSTGTLDRATGIASIRMLTPLVGLRSFYGTCTPLPKLF